MAGNKAESPGSGSLVPSPAPRSLAGRWKKRRGVSRSSCHGCAGPCRWPRCPTAPPQEGSALPSHHPVPSCPPRAQPGGSSPPSRSLRRRLHHAAILWPRRIYLAPPQRGEARRGEASPPAPSRSLAGLPPSAQQSQLSTASPGSLTVAVSGGFFATYWVRPGLSPKKSAAGTQAGCSPPLTPPRGEGQSGRRGARARAGG